MTGRRITATAALLLAIATPAQAGLLLSTTSAAAGPGASWHSDDGVSYDSTSGAFSIEFAGDDIFTGSENIDALSSDSGAYLLSTSTDATINGIAVRDGDLVRWDPVTSSTSVLISEDLFGGSDEDIDAAHLFNNGSLALSTTSTATLGGLTFRSRDVVLYDPVADLASLLWDGDLFDSSSENIDAVTLTRSGLLALSSSTDATVQGVAVLDGDLWSYDPATAAVSIIFAESTFTGATEDLDAAHISVPAPSTLMLLAIVLPILMRMRGAGHA